MKYRTSKIFRECVRRFSTSIFFMIRTHPGPWWTDLISFLFGADFAKIFVHKVRKFWLCGVNILGLVNPPFILKISSFMIDVFTRKRISNDCPFKSNQRPENFSILTPHCAVWLRSMMYIAELLRYLVFLTLWCDRWDFFKIVITWPRSGMYTAELDTTVGCTVHCGVRQTTLKMFCFLSCFRISFIFFNNIRSKKILE